MCSPVLSKSCHSRAGTLREESHNLYHSDGVSGSTLPQFIHPDSSFHDLASRYWFTLISSAAAVTVVLSHDRSMKGL
jgi:hypothetical protein